MKRKLREVGDHEDKFDVIERYKILRYRDFKRLSVTENRPQLFIERLIRRSHRGAKRECEKGEERYPRRITMV